MPCRADCHSNGRPYRPSSRNCNRRSVWIVPKVRSATFRAIRVHIALSRDIGRTRMRKAPIPLRCEEVLVRHAPIFIRGRDLGNHILATHTYLIDEFI